MARRRARTRPGRTSGRDRFDRYDAYGFAPYVPVADRKRQTRQLVERLRRTGRVVSPVEVSGRKISATFWGTAWCENLERYSDFANRLPRGRTYVRNGSVIDLQVGPGRVAALVSGSEIYEVAIDVRRVPAGRWKELCARCAGGIDSLVELLQAKFSEAVMGHLCQQGTGLFPTPAEISFSCSCPDAATMCKHVAAVFYAIGARLDQQPELLFRLRRVDERELIARATSEVPLTRAKGPEASRVLADEDLAEVFGIELGAPVKQASPKERRKTRSEKR